MNVSGFIARRYFLTRKKTNAINIISMISMVVFLTGAAVMIIILSLLNGLEDLVKSSDASFDPDLKISIRKGKVFDPEQSLKMLREVEGISGISLILEENVVVRYAESQEIARIKGVDSSYFSINQLDTLLVSGSTRLTNSGLERGILGVDLANRLNVHVENLAMPLEIMVPRRGVAYNSLDPSQSLSTGYLRPGGVLLINQESDRGFLIAPLAFVRKLLEYKKEVSSIEVGLKQGRGTAGVKQNIRERLGDDFNVLDRYEQNETAYRVFRSEKWMTFALLSLILIVAAFNAVGALTMLVLEKRRDLGVLDSMGLEPNAIRWIFRKEGMLISAAGGFVGVLFGLLFCFLQAEYGLIKLEGAMVEAFPVDVRWADVLIVYGILCAMGWLASLYPASLAVKLSKDRTR
ncbi:MAG: FtsX-like permease family protein [Flavobacteriales bacterium]|nr:FtsX-like permease family protein [Flavobacteriales bacterium]